MMECREIQKRLSEYIQGDVPEAEKKEFEEHIDNCSICRKELSLYEKTWRMLGSWQDVEPSSDFLPSFWRAVDASEKDEKRVKELSLGDVINRFLDLLRIRVPAWALAATFIVALFVGHIAFPQPVREKIVYRDVEKIVYVPSVEIAELQDPPMMYDKSDYLPSPYGVLKNTQENVPDSEISEPVRNPLSPDEGLQRLDLNELLGG